MTRLEQLRIDSLLTPEELGERVGLSGRQIRNIEEGKTRQPRMSTLARLSTHFAVPASELLRPAHFEREAA